MMFLPDGEPIIKMLTCQESGRLAAHATWDYAIHLRCMHPTHFIFIKACDCCGIMTEQTYVDGKGIEVIYSHEEVMDLIETTKPKPDLPF